MKVMIKALEFSRENWDVMCKYTNNKAHTLHIPHSTEKNWECQLESFGETIKVEEGSYILKYREDLFTAISSSCFKDFLGISQETDITNGYKETT